MPKLKRTLFQNKAHPNKKLTARYPTEAQIPNCWSAVPRPWVLGEKLFDHWCAKWNRKVGGRQLPPHCLVLRSWPLVEKMIKNSWQKSRQRKCAFVDSCIKKHQLVKQLKNVVKLELEFPKINWNPFFHSKTLQCNFSNCYSSKRNAFETWAARRRGETF